MREVYSRFVCGSFVVEYVRDSVSGILGLTLVPGERIDQRIAPREHLTEQDGPEFSAPSKMGWEMPADRVDPLVHVYVLGNPYPGGFSVGRTLRGAGPVLKPASQDVSENEVGLTVVTHLEDGKGLAAEHRLNWRRGEDGVRIVTTLENRSEMALDIGLLTSFSLDGITPFAADDAPGRLHLHRFRSCWSGEGRHDVQSIEALDLERSWVGHGTRCERYGQVGSLPSRGWFPFIAVEDRKAGVFWGAQLAWSGSWQMEAYRKRDKLALSGGLADYEFGHWMKRLQPGEHLESPESRVAVASGSLDKLCQALTSMQAVAADAQPAGESDLPIVFNEWCTTWGVPSHDNLVRIANRLQGSAVRYLVIDAGWFAKQGGNWGSDFGDWVPSESLFPDGLKATVDAIRERGLIPGIWFELENIGERADLMAKTELQLHRDGQALTCGGRRFLDFRLPAVHAYLEERVIDFLEHYGFGYMKVDYNESIGVGADGAESPGEALRQHIEGVHRFFRRLRERLPDLVIENCASGGHRLEPAMTGLTAMSSFSDAHETREIPIIAANLQRLMLPRQSQVWAVLHAWDSMQRLNYSLSAAFLGRMCLSGDVTDLDDAQWNHVLQAQALYREVWPIIKSGTSECTRVGCESYRHPEGWQTVCRRSEDGNSLLVVLHRFEQESAGDEVTIQLEKGRWKMTGSLVDDQTGAVVENGCLVIRGLRAFSGGVFALSRG